MDINSTDLLETLKRLSQDAGDNIEIDIEKLARQFDITVPKLISVLTELEHRDQIIMEIKTITDAAGELVQEGTVRLMERPPDELAE